MIPIPYYRERLLIEVAYLLPGLHGVFLDNICIYED